MILSNITLAVEIVSEAVSVAEQLMQELLTSAQAEFDSTMLWAVWKARGGRTISRRAPNGWFPELEEKRKALGQLDQLLARFNQRRGWQRAVSMWRAWKAAGTWKGGPEEPSRGDSYTDDRWKALLRKRHDDLGKELEGRVRSDLNERYKKRVQKSKKVFDAGRTGQLVNDVLGRRRAGGVIGEFTDCDGSVHRGSEEVTDATWRMGMRAFGPDGAQWPEDAEVQQATRLLYEDSPRGDVWRRALVNANGDEANWPPELGGMCSEEAQIAKRRLLLMARSKTGTLQKEYLGELTAAEWERHWAGSGGDTAPGASGVGPDLWKAAPGWLHSLARRLYSIVIALSMFPDQWAIETIVPVSKSGSASFSETDIRPIKLLEVSKNAVMSIIKERIRVDLEKRNLFDPAQHGFRGGRSTYSAALQLLGLYEQARAKRLGLHGVFLDIKRAYDTVERGAGKGLALARMGVGHDTIQFFLAADRGNRNFVRTGWEDLRRKEGHSPRFFTAWRGFPQGAAESPLLWIIFYDMVLTQLRLEGVGNSPSLPGLHGEVIRPGLVAFADDTAFFETSAQACQRSAKVVEDTLMLVCLRLAPAKSQHLAIEYKWTAHGRELCTTDEIPEQDRVQLGGIRVPLVGGDEVLRYLGFWIDGMTSWGGQADVLKARLATYKSAVQSRRLRKVETAYLYEAVLVPRLLYALILASIPDAEVKALESSMWIWQAQKFGLAPTYSRKLIQTGREWGGLGLEGLHSRTARRKADLAMLWRAGGEGPMQSIYLSMRAAYDEVQDARVSQELGERRRGEGTVWPSSGGNDGHFSAGLHFSLADQLVTWRDGGGERPWRKYDVRLSHCQVSERSRGLWLLNKFRWLSQLTDDDGALLPWGKLPGWSAFQLNAADKRSAPTSDGRSLPRAVSLGGCGHGAEWWAQAPAGSNLVGGLAIGAWVVELEMDIVTGLEVWSRVGRICLWELSQTEAMKAEGHGRMKIKVAVDFRSGYWNPRNDKLQAPGWRRWSEPVKLRPSPLGVSKQDDWAQEPADGGEVVDESSLRRVWAAWGGRPVSSLRDLYIWHKASSRSFIPRPDLPVDPLEVGDSGDVDQSSSESEDEDSAEPADQTVTIDVDEGESP